MNEVDRILAKASQQKLKNPLMDTDQILDLTTLEKSSNIDATHNASNSRKSFKYIAWTAIACVGLFSLYFVSNLNNQNLSVQNNLAQNKPIQTNTNIYPKSNQFNSSDLKDNQASELLANKDKSESYTNSTFQKANADIAENNPKSNNKAQYLFNVIDTCPQEIISPEKLQNYKEANIGSVKFINLSHDELLKFGIEVCDSNVIYTSELVYNSNIINELLCNKAKSEYETTKRQFEKRNFENTLKSNGYDINSDKFIYKVQHRLRNSKFGEDESFIIENKNSSINNYSSCVPVAHTKHSEYFKFANDRKTYSKHDQIVEYINEKSPLLNFDYKDLFVYNGGKFLSKSGKLVPVKILLGDTNRTNKDNFAYSEITFWFVPNKEFVDLLPARYQEIMSKELGILEEIESGCKDPKYACQELQSNDSYLDICQLTSSNIRSAVIYPIPAFDHINLKIDLAQESNIKVNLYQTSGQFIKTLSNTRLKSGSQELSFELEHLQEGLYIVGIMDDNGSQVLQRMIVR